MQVDTFRLFSASTGSPEKSRRFAPGCGGATVVVVGGGLFCHEKSRRHKVNRHFYRLSFYVFLLRFTGKQSSCL